MGRLREPEVPPSGELDDYRAARLCRGLAMRLAVPATTDEAAIRRCREALERGNRRAAGADDWPDRVAALAAVAEDVLGVERVARIRRGYENEEPAGDAARRATYVHAMGRRFDSKRRTG